METLRGLVAAAEAAKNERARIERAKKEQEENKEVEEARKLFNESLDSLKNKKLPVRTKVQKYGKLQGFDVLEKDLQNEIIGFATLGGTELVLKIAVGNFTAIKKIPDELKEGLLAALPEVLGDLYPQIRVGTPELKNNSGHTAQGGGYGWDENDTEVTLSW